MSSRARRFDRAEPRLDHDASLQAGLVVATHGRHCIVETPERTRLICHPRGKKSEVVVGDRVRWRTTGDEGVIEQIEPRRNLFFRQDEWRSKSFAANLDQLLVWIAVEPVFSEMQLTRALIAADAAGIPATIVLNKVDLPGADAARQRLAPYRAMGLAVLECSLRGTPHDTQALLLPRLHARASLVLGPSGAGKSTLINTLAPHARAEVGAISEALNCGRHTTTTTQWYWLDGAEGEAGTALIDSPGFQEFGLHHIPVADLARHMPDLAHYIGQCRFHNCTHLHEPGCAVRSAADAGAISAHRLKLYADLHAELSQPRW